MLRYNGGIVTVDFDRGEATRMHADNVQLRERPGDDILRNV